MTLLPFTSGITLLIVLMMFWTAFDVGAARKRHDVRAPAVTGHPDFERAYRIQMNTLEWAVMTLPCLWICAAFVGDAIAAALGSVWVAGRIWYRVSYRRDPSRRGPAFLLAALAFGALGVGAAGGVVVKLLGA